MTSNLQKNNFIEVGVNDAGKFIRLFFINEIENHANAGVVLGSFFDTTGLHITYHNDGNMHFRKKRRIDLLKLYRKTPICEISAFQHLLLIAFKAKGGWIAHQSKVSTREPTQRIVVDSYSPQLGKQITLSFFIINKTKQYDFDPYLATFHHAYNVEKKEFLPLTRYPNQLIAIVYLSYKY